MKFWIADILCLYHVHVKGADKSDNVCCGVYGRLDTIQAAILLEKLAIFPQELINRNKAAANYKKSLPSHLVTPDVPEGYISSWAQYTVRSEQREQDMKAYQEKGIPTMVYYRTCMHQQTAFSHLGYQAGDFPVAEKLSKQVYSLPIHGYMK